MPSQRKPQPQIKPIQWFYLVCGPDGSCHYILQTHRAPCTREMTASKQISSHVLQSFPSVPRCAHPSPFTFTAHAKRSTHSVSDGRSVEMSQSALRIENLQMYNLYVSACRRVAWAKQETRLPLIGHRPRLLYMFSRCPHICLREFVRHQRLESIMQFSKCDHEYHWPTLFTVHVFPAMWIVTGNYISLCPSGSTVKSIIFNIRSK